MFCFPFFATQVFSPSVYVDVALQKQLEELLNSCYYIPSKEEASKVEVMMKLLIVLMLMHIKTILILLPHLVEEIVLAGLCPYRWQL